MPFQDNLTEPRARISPRARRNLLVGFLAVVAFGLAVLVAAWSRACAGNTCPSIEELGGYDPDQASKVYAADGRLITDLGLERRTVIPLGEMSPYVKTAFLATEDKRFYSHHGIDWYRVFGAIRTNVFALRFAEGFSTITMQLARNIWDEDISGTDKSLRRKLREAHVALDIERKYPKDKILEIYLNQIPLGNGAYGVEAASQRYFGKSVRDLNVAEAATLAAIPKAPTRYNPRRNPNLNIQRRNTVLNLLRDNGLLNAEDTERWKAYPLLLSSHSDFSGVAEYFVEYVRQQLEARFGRELYTSGYRIYTTLDLDIQQAAERALEAGSKPSRAAPTGNSPTRPTGSSWNRGPTTATTTAGPPRRISRAWPSRSRPRPATSGPWWVGATSMTASSIAPPRRCGSPGRPSSRSSMRPRSRRDTRSRT